MINSTLRRFAIVNPNASAWGTCHWFAPHARRFGLWVLSNGDTYHSAELIPCRTFSIGQASAIRLSDSVDVRNLVLRVIRAYQSATAHPIASLSGDDSHNPCTAIGRAKPDTLTVWDRNVAT